MHTIQGTIGTIKHDLPRPDQKQLSIINKKYCIDVFARLRKNVHLDAGLIYGQQRLSVFEIRTAEPSRFWSVCL